MWRVLPFILVIRLAGAADPLPADQREYPDSVNGCAPATMLNLLRFGGPEMEPALKSLLGSNDGVKMRFLVDRYFKNRPSLTAPDRKRWGLHGVECEDLAAGANDLLTEHGLDPLVAIYLDRDDGESESAHLARVYRLIAKSLSGGMPPVLSLRSFLVKRREENDDKLHWETAVNHYVLITALRGESSETGFEVEVIDPWQGQRTVIYIHREATGRSFRALKGNEDTGVWLDGRPFLQVLAPGVPSLRPANVEWSDRYLVIANHLLGRF